MPTSTFYNLPKEKQDRILNSAIKEFAQRGINDANLSNIIRDSKISRGSLYQYFIDKQDIYVYTFQTLDKQRNEHVSKAYHYFKTEPFLRFYEELYLLDSEYLFKNPLHVKMGRNLYSSSSTIAMGLVTELKRKYREDFLIAIEFDKHKEIIKKDISSSALANLCVYFVTDVFIFQNSYAKMSIEKVKEDLNGILDVLKNGMYIQ